MLKTILEIEGAVKLNTRKQKIVIGGRNCQLCYANNYGYYNSADPNCWECPLPVPHE